jgi:tRNA nucleotidyltransferase (CCA-adding enzyme)
MNVNGKAFPVSEEAWLVIGCLKTAGATAVYIVGGSVRNFFLGKDIKDYDLEIYGLTSEQIMNAVSHLGSISLVGTHFKVIKLRTSPKVEFDLSIPRREWKTGPMHVDFHIEADKDMTTLEAAARRDFTINSGMYDPMTDTLVDHYGFVHDIEHRILRPTSNQFADDPLRVLRGMWLAGMGFNMPSRYNAMMASLAKYYPTISRERVWEEWFKWASRSDKPSAGIEFLLSAGWLGIYPEINELVGCPQEPKHHPEGDAFIHTCMSMDYMVSEIFPRVGIEKETDEHAMLVDTMLLHDSAKPQTTYRDPEDGEIKSPGHDQMGAKIMVPRFMDKIGRVNPDQKKADHFVEMITILVANHMRHIGLKNPTRKNVRSMALDIGNLSYLSYVVEADNSARFPKPGGLPPQMKAIMDIAAEIELEQEKPKPILNGEILIKLGMVPGIAIGKMIRESFDAQMDEEFSDMFGAIAWAKKKLDSV